MRFLCLYLLVQAVACRQALTPAKPATADQRPSIPAVTVNRGDTSLQLVNGVWFLQGQPFSGSIETRYGSGQLWVIQQVYEGKEEGLMRSYYENGRQQALRFYHLGEKIAFTGDGGLMDSFNMSIISGMVSMRVILRNGTLPVKY